MIEGKDENPTMTARIAILAGLIVLAAAVPAVAGRVLEFGDGGPAIAPPTERARALDLARRIPTDRRMPPAPVAETPAATAAFAPTHSPAEGLALLGVGIVGLTGFLIRRRRRPDYA